MWLSQALENSHYHQSETSSNIQVSQKREPLRIDREWEIGQFWKTLLSSLTSNNNKQNKNTKNRKG